MFFESDLNIRAPIISGLSGLITAVIFTFSITGAAYFLDFLIPISIITSISSVSAIFTHKKSITVQALIGVFLALTCCILILMSAVSNI